MKLATLKDGSRDGQLLVVARDLRTAVIADPVAPHLQRVLDDWAFHGPQLEALYAALNRGDARYAFPFEPRDCMAPLPRAVRWVGQGSAPATASKTTAGMRDHAPDAQGAPHDPLPWPPQATGMMLRPAIAVIVDELAAQSDPAQALEAVRLVMLVHDLVSQTPAGSGLETAASAHWPEALARACAPLALTPDELGAHWQAGQLRCHILLGGENDTLTPLESMAPAQEGFGDWLAALARWRPLSAGTVLSATLTGVPAWRVPQASERVRLDARNSQDASLFGVLSQSFAAG